MFAKVSATSYSAILEILKIFTSGKVGATFSQQPQTSFNFMEGGDVLNVRVNSTETGLLSCCRSTLGQSLLGSLLQLGCFWSIQALESAWPTSQQPVHCGSNSPGIVDSTATDIL